MQVRHHHYENLVSRHRSTSLQMLRCSFSASSRVEKCFVAMSGSLIIM